MNYFINTDSFIEGNTCLRYPQRRAHKRLMESFSESLDTHKVVVLPTGAGKTGVIALAPYSLSNGRVLVITPNLIIRQGISDQFDTRTPFNFWSHKAVILDDEKLPAVYRYAGYGSASDKKRVLTYLSNANIVIANIHKVYNEKSQQPLVNLLSKDFFDMIIIDEAHHSAANSWKKTLEYFDARKIVKLTATPYRADAKELEGEIVYAYELSDAIKDGLVKNLIAEDHTTQKLEFEIDGCLVDKETALEQMDKPWITRSVAYSEACSRTIVEMSIERLMEKRRLGSCHHQIIAVACSIDHAKQIMKLYKEHGLSAEYVSSDRPDQSEQAIIEYKKGQIDVLVNVNMLGEGFDHSNISIAAIFRPFRTLAPYAQFIGRALRRIKEPDPIDEIDNVAHIVYHKELDLDELWEYYTGQKIKATRRREIEEEYERDEGIARLRDIGKVSVNGAVVHNLKSFLADGIALKYSSAIKREIEKLEAEISAGVNKMKVAGFSSEEIEDFIRARKKRIDSRITQKRNKLREELVREELQKYHKDDIVNQVANILEVTRLDPKGVDLPSNTSSPYLKSAGTNEGYMIKYINSSLKQKLKRGIEEWETYDFEEARKLIPELAGILKQKIERLGMKV